MKKEDIPQDGSPFGNLHTKYYAPDENGDYAGAASSGWEPINIANNIAWECINEDLADKLERVKKGELSTLEYYMNKLQLDPKVLARYVGLAKWRVKRHLKPDVFNKLDNETL